MNKQKLLTSIKQSFMVKRYKAQEECEEFITSLGNIKKGNTPAKQLTYYSVNS